MMERPPTQEFFDKAMESANAVQADIRTMRGFLNEFSQAACGLWQESDKSSYYARTPSTSFLERQMGYK